MLYLSAACRVLMLYYGSASYLCLYCTNYSSLWMQFLPCFVCLKLFVNFNYTRSAFIRAKGIVDIQPFFIIMEIVIFGSILILSLSELWLGRITQGFVCLMPYLWSYFVDIMKKYPSGISCEDWRLMEQPQVVCNNGLWYQWLWTFRFYK
jgi:hypothetical protein